MEAAIWPYDQAVEKINYVREKGFEVVLEQCPLLGVELDVIIDQDNSEGDMLDDIDEGVKNILASC